MRIALEKHKTSDGYHIHAYVDSGYSDEYADGIQQLNNERELDYCDIHPNITPVRVTPWKAWDYTGKDNDIIYEVGDAPKAPEKKLLPHETYFAIIEESTSKDKFLKNCVKRVLRDACVHFNSLSCFSDYWYSPTASYESPGINCYCADYPQLSDWVQTSLRATGNGRKKSLVLFGGTLLGKTLWARSLGTHA
jgi:hypothetical protein